MNNSNDDRGGSAAPDSKASPLALAHGSACLVCGSTLTLQIRRGPDGVLDLLHCNHCGSEVPRHIPQRYRMRADLVSRCAQAIRDLDRVTPRPLTAEDQARAVLTFLANNGDLPCDGQRPSVGDPRAHH